MSIKAPRGVNDILPSDSLKWQFIRRQAEEAFAKFNYEELMIPIFEYTELFQRGIGETTDVVEKEMYTFLDKGGRSITLRPEGTASVMRSFIEHKIYGQIQPTKYFYFGPMFRYERPQAGRYRQFYQLGAEALGVDNPLIDAEVIALGLHLLDALGVREHQLYLNSIGCFQCRSAYRDLLQQFFAPHLNHLCADCQRRHEKNPLRILDCKNLTCQSYLEGAPAILDHLCANCATDFSKVCSYLDLLEIDYTIDPGIVRGLDYYTKTSFEIKYAGLGAQDTLIGGGRYDGLGQEIGGKDVPGIGFAMGIERLLLAMEDQLDRWPVERTTDLFIISIGEEATSAAFKYLHQLRNTGLKAGMDYLGRSVKGQMKMADRQRARYSIILGDSELAKGLATIKDMQTGDQEEIALNDLIEAMEKKVK